MNKTRWEKIPSKGPLFLFRSCMANELYPFIESSLHKIFDMLDIEWVESDDQACCGGVFENLTSDLSIASINALNFSIIEPLAKNVVTPCNECFSALQNTKEFLGIPENKVKVDQLLKKVGKKTKNQLEFFHVIELFYKNLDKIVQKKKHDLSGLHVVVHYGCHYIRTHRETILDDHVYPFVMDEILKALEIESVDYTEKALCCGQGYIQKIINPDASLEISYKKIKSIAQVDPDAIINICPQCMNILDNAPVLIEVEKDENYEFPVIHINQLIGLYLGLDPINDLGLDSHNTSTERFLKKISTQEKTD